MNSPLTKYEQALANLPKPGFGLGFHTGSLGVARLGVKAGLSSEKVLKDLREKAQGGRRVEPHSQIVNTVRLAFAGDANCVVSRASVNPCIYNPEKALHRLVDEGLGVTEADIIAASPITIPDRPEDHAIALLENLYPGDALIFIGERHEAGGLGGTIRTPSEWSKHFRKGAKPAPHIIPNPLTGKPAPKKSSEGMTYRGDRNVSIFGICIAESDTLSREEQWAFWSAVNLPIIALIDSGGKSLHAWISVPKLAPVHNDEEWDCHIRDHLYGQLLVPLGVDKACSNPARLSRLPGHFRSDKGRMQCLLYLAPEGRRIFS